VPPASIAHLPPDILASLSRHGAVRSFARNVVLIHEGDDSNSLFIILSGRVKAYLADDNGHEITLSLQGPGEYFGEMVLDGGPRSASVVTVEPTQCVVVPRSELEKLLTGNPDFALHLIRDLMHRTRRLTDSVRSLALLDVYGRVARVLIDLARDVDGRQVVTERLTQQDIANRIGASREMVSRIFRDLERGGYVHHEGDRIVIDHPPPPRW